MVIGKFKLQCKATGKNWITNLAPRLPLRHWSHWISSGILDNRIKWIAVKNPLQMMIEKCKKCEMRVTNYVPAIFNKFVYFDLERAKLDWISMSDYERIRLVVLGGAGVGKSAILRRLLGQGFTERYRPTVEDLYSRECILGTLTLKVDLLDTAGKDTILHANGKFW